MTPADGPHQHGSAPSGRTDDPTAERTGAPSTGNGAGTPPPASVAEEAAMLVDLLSRRGWSGPPRAPSGESGPDGADESPRSAGPDDTGPGACTCGGTTPSACRVCPVCQVIAVVQRVSPDTIERVADFVGFAATALRELATAQRERQAARDENENENGGTGPEGGA